MRKLSRDHCFLALLVKAPLVKIRSTLSCWSSGSDSDKILSTMLTMAVPTITRTVSLQALPGTELSRYGSEAITT